MKGVCVVGSSKTGTTGLYSAVWNGLRAHEDRVYGLLEKYDEDVYRNLQRLAPSTPVVSKVLLTNNSFSADLVARFDRRLLIVRDPRDTLLSVALYYPVRALNRGATQHQIDEYVDLVRTKERDPASVSFMDLLVAVYRLSGQQVDETSDFSRRYRVATRFASQLDAYTVYYERFIHDDLADVSDHLGFEIHNARPSDYSGIVLRSGGAGEWRHWFLPSDVEAFRPVMTPYMERFGYEDDWEVASDPQIDPANGSEYVQGAVAKRRRQLEIGQSESGGHERLQQLRERADEGAHTAAFRVAQQLREMSAEEHAEEIVERLRFAASCGHIPAMRELADVLAESSAAHEQEEAEGWRAEADAEAERRDLRQQAASSPESVKDLRRDLKRTRAQLRRLRRSRKVRVGDAVARAARGGMRERVRLPMTVLRILRDRGEQRGR